MISSILLALAGGAGAIAIAYAVAHSVLRLAFRGSEYVPVEVNPSLPVLGFAVLGALVTAVLCAAIPAWISTKTDPASAIRGTSRTMKDSSSAVQRVLVITQAALSVVLLCAAGLLLRSLNNLQKQDFGFQTEDRYIVGIDPFLAGYKPEQTDDLYRKLHESLMRIPGTKKVAFALYTPLSHDNWNGGIFIPGQPDPKPDSDWYQATYIRISPEYFDAIGAKLRTGRFFTDGDDNHGRKVAIVNQVFADRYFHGKAIGQHFGIERELESQFEIVGIMENTKHNDPNVPPPPMYYLPFGQATEIFKPQNKAFEPLGHYAGQVVLETASTTPASLEAATRRAFAEVNPLLTPQYFRTFSAQVATNFNQDELLARLTSLFGLVALILASIGLYGVTAYSVERRTGEIGVRMALGADRASILRDVLKRAMTHCVLGLAIGVPLAYAAGRLMAQHLYGVGAFDAPVAIITLVMLSMAAAVAAFVPARRAASIEPMVALRME
jgi:predicted permease